MFYVIADTLLKVVNMFYAITNIVESGVKHQKTGHHVLHYRYNVEHGDQFYWCLTTFSTM
jgi:hypothetical protein